METEDLQAYLDEVAFNARLVVERTLKRSDAETTELVRLDGDRPEATRWFVRKRMVDAGSFGSAYELLHRAQREGRRFRHVPSIVVCANLGTERVVVMEYVAGETLDAYIARCGAGLETLARVLPGIADAVEELHRAFRPPIVHRDLKPSNIIVGPQGIVLVDFGIARQYRLGSMADTERFGTRGYAPPEQFGFGQTDVRSDVYALGMIAHVCLTGTLPTDGSASACMASEPSPLAQVLDRATAFDPDARYQTVAQFKAALLDAIDAVRVTIASGKAPKANRLPASERIGMAWNIVVALIWAFFLAICVWLCIFPQGSSAAWPPGLRVTCYIGFFMPLVTGAGYLLLDKRPLRRLMPWLAARSRFFTLKVVFGCVCVAAVCLVAASVASYVLGV